MSGRTRTGGQVLVDQLLVHGVDRAFCVPGESYLEVLDALYDVRDRIALVNARHEAGAADMAEAYGKLTHRPGICLVTRGPGACHAAVGVHIARQDSTPMILFVGQVGRATADRESFQEIDYRAMFGGVAKWVAQIDDPARLPEYLARAFRTAMSGRPGPVVLALPEDMLTQSVAVADAPAARPTRATLSDLQADAVIGMLREAERPLVIAGGPGWSDAGATALRSFAEGAGLPVAASFRRQDVIDNRSAAYVGDFGTGVAPSLVARLAEADMVLALGARLGEITTKAYATIRVPTPDQALIHIHPDPDEIGRVYAPSLGLAADPSQAAEVLATRPAGRIGRADWSATLRREHIADLEPPAHDFPLDMGRALAAMRDHWPEGCVFALDAGNHTGWAQRYVPYGRPGRQIASTCGAMGYAVPAAISASLVDPSRQVVAFVGDGGFMMSGAEIATAVQHGARPVVFLFNNCSYGTIRMHQERAHPGRVSGTDLVNPDFGLVARGLGAEFALVTRTEEVRPALETAFACPRPTVIELVTDPDRISTRSTISQLHGLS